MMQAISKLPRTGVSAREMLLTDHAGKILTKALRAELLSLSISILQIRERVVCLAKRLIWPPFWLRKSSSWPGDENCRRLRFLIV